MSIETSRDENIPDMYLDLFHLRSLVWSTLALIPAPVIYFLLRGFLPAPFPFLALLIPPVVAWCASEYLFGGEFPAQRTEKILEKFVPEDVRRDFNEDPRFKRNAASENLQIDQNQFVILAYKIESAGENPDTIREKFRNIIRRIPDDVCLQFTKIHKRIGEDSPARSLRPWLCENGLFESFYYISFRFWAGARTKGGDPVEDMLPQAVETEFMGSSQRMTSEEISRINEWILSPIGVPGTGAYPVLSDTHRFEKGFGRSSELDYVCQASSLIELPATIDGKFSALFDLSSQIESVVTVQFFGKRDELFSRMILNRTTENADLSKNTANVSRRKKSLLRRSHAKAEGDLTSLEMFINVVAWGPRVAGDGVLKDVISQGSKGDVGAQFCRDTAFIEESLLAALLGSSVRVRTRAFKVSSAWEAAHYCPLPTPKPLYSFTPTMVFPTYDNAPYLFSHIESASHPGTAIVGVSGGGKSALASLYIDATLSMAKLGHSIAIGINDVGGSFRFFAMTHATASIDIRLGKPLCVHPLAAFLWVEDPVSSWLGFVIELLAPSSANLMTEVFDPQKLQALKRVLNEFREKSKSYSLQELDALFKERLEVSQWKDELARFSEFLPGGLYGSTYSPLNPPVKALTDARLLYLNIEKREDTDEVFLRFSKISLLFIHRLLDLHANTFKADADDLDKAVNNCHIFDEYFYQKRFLQHEKLTHTLSQIRKGGGVMVVLTQRIDDFLVPGMNAKALQESFERYWIFDKKSSTKSLRIALGQDADATENDAQSEDTQDFRHLKKLLSEMWKERVSQRLYSSVYIDESKKPVRLRTTIEPSFLWRITTNPGGIKIRNRALKFYGNDVEFVCKALAEKGPKEIPKKIPNPEYIESLVKYVLGVADSHQNDGAVHAKKSKNSKRSARSHS